VKAKGIRYLEKGGIEIAEIECRNLVLDRLGSR
jgi:hypothetical protein